MYGILTLKIVARSLTEAHTDLRSMHLIHVQSFLKIEEVIDGKSNVERQIKVL